MNWLKNETFPSKTVFISRKGCDLSYFFLNFFSFPLTQFRMVLKKAPYQVFAFNVNKHWN